MSFPQPINADNVDNVGAMVALGMVGSPPMEFVFSGPLRFAAGAAANTAIATLTNAPGDTLAISPTDDRVRWDGNVLEVGAVSTAAPTTLYYVVTRTRGDIKFSQTIAVAAI